MRPPRPASALLCVLAALWSAACTSGTDGSVPATTARPAGTARPIVNPTIRLPRSTLVAGGATPGSFPAPAVEGLEVDAPPPCRGDQPVATRVRYTARGADRVVIVVDDVQLPDPAPLSGDVRITLPCDDAQHYVAVIAAAPDNQVADDKRLVFGSRQGT